MELEATELRLAMATWQPASNLVPFPPKRSEKPPSSTRAWQAEKACLQLMQLRAEFIPSEASQIIRAPGLLKGFRVTVLQGCAGSTVIPIGHPARQHAPPHAPG